MIKLKFLLNHTQKKTGQKAFSFSVIKNSTLKFGIGVELSEARVLKSLFDLYLFKYFNY